MAILQAFGGLFLTEMFVMVGSIIEIPLYVHCVCTAPSKMHAICTGFYFVSFWGRGSDSFSQLSEMALLVLCMIIPNVSNLDGIT